MSFAVAWEVALVGPPAHLTGLTALAHEAIDRPRIDELADFLRLVRTLRVAFGDMDDLHAHTSSQIPPISSGRRISGVDADVRRDVQERLLDEVRDKAGIRAMCEHGRWGTCIACPQRQRFLAHCVVRPFAGRHGGIGVATGPRLNARVQVHRTLFPTQLDQREARHLDRDVHQEVSPPKQRVEDAAIVFARQRLLDDLHA